MTRRSAGANDRELQLERPGRRAYVVLFLLAVALPTLLGTLLPWLDEGVRSGVSVGALVLGLSLVVYLALVLVMRRHRLQIDAGGIEVATTFYTRHLRWEQLRLDAARVIDIQERTELRPAVKSNGVSMPGFHSGRFRARNLGRLFVATAGGRRLLWLPTHEGYDLLLQPRKPAAALERMKALAATQAMAPGSRGR